MKYDLFKTTFVVGPDGSLSREQERVCMGTTQVPLYRSETGSIDASDSLGAPVRCESLLNGRPTNLFLNLIGAQIKTDPASSQRPADSIIEHGEIKAFVGHIVTATNWSAEQPNVAPGFDYIFSVTATRELGASNHLIFVEPQHTMVCPTPGDNLKENSNICVPRNPEFFQAVFEVVDKG